MSYVNYQSRKLPGFVRYAADLLRYRHLCWNLVESDLRARFRRSKVGILWTVIQPLGFSLIIAWAWGTIFRVPDYWEYAAYVFSGMLVWEFFANTVTSSLDGLISAGGYLKQARVPLFVFQLRIPLSGMVNFLFGFVGLMIFMSLQMLPPVGEHLLLLPAFAGVLILFMTPLAVLFSILGAQLRDLKHIMGLVLSLMFILSPVMMARSYLDTPELAVLKFANPAVALLDLFRAPLLHGQYWETQSVVTVCAWGGGLWLLAIIASAQAGRRIIYAL
jgi:lipopolysaccharide transport system permease protein